MRKNSKLTLLYLFIIMCSCVSHNIYGQKTFSKPKYKAHSHGVPAAPDAIKLLQPDGSKIDAYLKGDGAVHWHQTPDGYTILKGKNGYFEYATSDKRGNLKSSGVKVNNKEKRKSDELNVLTKTSKDMRYSKSQADSLKNNFLPASSNGPSNAFPTSGTRNLLMILIDFPDRAHTFPPNNFDNLMNQTGYNGTGSFKDYYSANSFGQLNVVTTVTGWYTASHNHDYYCDDCSGSDHNNTYRQLVREAVDAAEANGINFSNYDNDHDGIVDGIMVIHQGEGAERGDPTNIWSHSWLLNPGSSYSNLSVTYDGVLINDYTLNPETNRGLMGTIGVMCHEFGHSLGLPDFYDTYNEAIIYTPSFDLGNWDCMAHGSYNNGSATPANHNSYSRNMLGWQTATELSTPATITLPNAAQNNISYYYSTPTPNEFFWVENRQQIQGTFDQYIPGHGMLIYHIDLNSDGWSNNRVNAYYNHNAMDIEEADNMRSSSTVMGDAFPGSSNNTSFTDFTIPNSIDWSGKQTNKAITNIMEGNNIISFTFMGGENNIPEKFNAKALSQSQINLSWKLNQNDDPVLVAWSSTGVFGTPVDGVDYSQGNSIPGGGTVLYYGSSMSIEHNILNSQTIYYYRIWSKVGNVSYSVGIDANAKTFCGAISTFPFTENFEIGSLPSCWSEESGPPNWQFVTGNGSNYPPNAHSGQINALLDYNLDGANKRNKLITPAFNLASVSNPTLKFWHTQKPWSGDQDILRIYYKTSYSGSWNLLATYSDEIPDWKLETISLPNASNEYYIAFEGSLYYGHGICIDDISVYSACTPPTKQSSYFSASNITSNSMTVCWTRGNGSNVLVVANAGKALTVYPVDGASYVANSVFGSGQEIGIGNFVVYNGAGNSVNITGLASNVDYSFNIYEYNNASLCYLNPPLRANASKLCSSNTFPYTIDFENGGKIPDCWTQEDDPTIWINRYYDPIWGVLDPPAPHGGSYYIRLKDYSKAPNRNKFISPSLNLTSVSNPALKFWHMQDWTMPDDEAGMCKDELRVYYKTSINGAWNLLATYTNYISNWKMDTIFLPNPSSDYYIAFEGDARHGGGVCIDDISIYSECAPSNPPTNFSASNVGSNSMTIGWARGNGNSVIVLARAGSPVNISPSNGTSYSANPIYGSGQQIGTGNYVVYNGTGNSVDLTGLAPGAKYYYAIYEYNNSTICYLQSPLTGNSSTICPSITFPYTENFEGGALSSCWMQETGPPKWRFLNGNGWYPYYTAHGGVYNACLSDDTHESNRNKLISPSFDLTKISNPTLTFWHMQYTSVPNERDELRVYYKTSASGTWKLLSTYLEMISDWTMELINLPEPSDDYYLAFEGDALGGFGVFIDDIKVYSGCESPSAQASNLSISNVTANSMTIGWTRGNGSNVIVVAKAESAVDLSPSNGTTYIANPVFGLGQDIGNGNFVVYIGTGNSVNITGLPSGRKYYFAIYEYNNSAQCYLLSNPLIGNVITHCSEFTFPYSESFEGGRIPDCWSQDPGIPNWEYVYPGHSGYYMAHFSNSYTGINKKLMSPAFKLNTVSNPILEFWHAQKKKGQLADPWQDELRIYYKTTINGEWNLLATYTDNIPDWQKETINLPNPSEDYYIAFEGESHSGFGVDLDDVRIYSGCQPPSVQASNFSVSNQTGNSMTISWTRGNGNSVLVVAKAGSPVNSFPAPGNKYTANAYFSYGQQIGTGNYVVYNGTGTSVNVTGLSAGTNYHYAIYEYDTTSDCYLMVPALNGNAYTNCPAITYPYNESFEGGKIPGCWSQELTRPEWQFISGNGNSYPSDAHGGGYNACLKEDNSFYYKRNKLISPAFDLTSVLNPTLKFWYIQEAREYWDFSSHGYMNDNLRVYYKTSISGDWNLLDTFTLSTNSWKEEKIILPNPNSHYYIAFDGDVKGAWGVCLDDISIYSGCQPPLNQASNFAASNITTKDMTLQWAKGDGSNTLVIARADSSVNMPPLNETSYTANSEFGLGQQIGTGNFVVYNGTSNSVNITGLSANKNYHFAIYEFNSNAQCYLLDNPLLGEARTNCPIISFPYKEGFEDEKLFGCWSQENIFLNWTIRGNGSYSGLNCLYLPSYSWSSTKRTLVSPSYDLSSVSNPVLSFWYKQPLKGTNQDQLRIYYRTTNNSEWHLLAAYTDNIPNWTKETISLPNPGVNYYIAFEGSTNNGNGIYIDDISISQGCQTPASQASDFSVSEIKINSMTIGWTRGSGSNVLVIAKEGSPVNESPLFGSSYSSNSTFGMGQEIGTGNYVVYNGTGTSVNITGLLSSLNYHFAIFEYNNSSYCYLTPPARGNALTACSLVIFPYTINFDNGKIPDCWTQETVSPLWQFIAGNGGSHPSYGRGGSSDACLKDQSTTSNRNKLISPPLNLLTVLNPTLNFWYFQQAIGIGYQDELRVYYKTSAGGSWNLLATYLDNISNWTMESINLPNPSDNYYIAFEGDAKYGYGVCIDDISIYSGCLSPSLQVSNFMVTDVSSNTTTIGWTRGNGNSVLVIGRAGSPVNGIPSNGTSYTANAAFGSGQEIGTGNFVVYNGSGTSVNVTDLYTNLNYYYAIYEYNNSSNCYLTPPLRGKVGTPCPSITFPYTQDFSKWPLACWDSTGGTFNWKPYLNNAAVANFWTSLPPKNALTATPVLDFTTLTNPELTFKWSHLYNSAYPNDELKIEISVDGSNWTTIWDKGQSALNSNDGASSHSPGTFVQEKVNLTAYAGQATVKIRLNGISGYGSDLFIDDFSIKQACSGPTINSTTNNSRCGAGSVVLNSAVASGTINWYSTLSGGTPLGSGTSFTTPYLSATTTYYVDVTDNGCITPTRTAVTATIEPAPLIVAKYDKSSCDPGKLTLGAISNLGIVNWYNLSTGGSVLGTGTSFTTPDLISTTTYYVDATNNNCKTPSRTPVIATISEPPIITVLNNPSRCSPGSLTLNVSVNEGSVNWYSSPIGGDWLMNGKSYNTPYLSNTTTYYVDVTKNGCKSTSRTPITAKIDIPIITSVTNSSRCGTGQLNLSATINSGYIRWYDVPMGGTYLQTGTNFLTPSLNSTKIYYAEAYNGCASYERTPVTATIKIIPSIISTSSNSRCGQGLLMLVANSNYGSINWYSAQTGGTSLGIGTNFTTPDLTSTTNYYVDATYDGCTSTYRNFVTATIKPIPTILSVTNALRCGPGTLNLSANPSMGTVNWYIEPEGGVLLGSGINFITSNISSTTTFYAEVSNNGCTSPTRTPIIATVTSNVINNFPFTENFESGKFPDCWTQSGSLNWQFYKGNGSSNPSGAHGGIYNACLKDYTTSSNKSMLISPSFELTSVSNPTMQFWHTQQLNGYDQDELRVFYRTSATGSWNLLATYKNNIVDWTLETINLPNPSNDYYIAFEADAKSGYGICIDDISLYSGCFSPSVQASNLSITDKKANSLTIGWTRGDGTNILVVARAGAPVSTHPLNGITYHANETLGSGQEIGNGNFVIYDGAGTSVNIKGLSALSKYYFAIYEYNSASHCYLLSPLVGEASTPCRTITYPYTEGFEGGTIPNCWSQAAGPPTWQFIKGNGSANPGNTRNGLFNACLNYSSTASNRNKLISTSFDLTSISTPTLRFWHTQQAQNTYQDELRIYYKTSINDSWILLATYSNNITDWTMEKLYLPNPSSDYYIAFEGDAKHGFGVCIDDITISSGCISPTIQASNFKVTNLSTNFMTLNWTRGNGDSILVLARAGGSVSDVPADGIRYNASSTFGFGQQIGTGNYVVYNGTDTSFTFTGLSSYVNYNFAIYEYNSETHCYMSSPLKGNVTTPCVPTSIPYKQGFEGQVIPNCWIQEAGPPVWQFIQGSGNNGYAHSGSYNACLKDYSNESNKNKLISPPFDLSSASNPTLEFWHYQKRGATYKQDELRVYYKTSANGTWNLLSTYTKEITGWTMEKINLPNPSSNYYIAFEGDAKNGNGVCIDDVSIYSGCLLPTIPASDFVVSEITPNSMKIGWTRGNGTNVLVVACKQSSIDGYPTDGTFYVANEVFGMGQNLYYPSESVVYNGSGNSVTVKGLTPFVRYFFAIYEYNNYSKCYMVNPLTGSASTICSTATIPYYEGFENGQNTTCWVQEGGPPAWAYTTGSFPCQPSSSNGGKYIARLSGSTSGSPRNKLISPSIDLASVSNPTLSFWHMQLMNNNYQDELRIYYKTSVSGSWNLLTTYTNNIAEWTKEKIILPEPTSDYYIAFEGDAKNGYGVCLDNISVYSGCPSPSVQASAFSASSITTNSMTIGWNRGTGTNVLVIARAGSSVNEYPIDGTSYIANSIFGLGQEIGIGNFVVYNGTGASVNISGLFRGVSYYYAIYEYDNASQCYLIQPLQGNAFTNCTLFTIPYLERFEGGIIPACWSQEAGPPTWQFIKGNGSSYLPNAHEGVFNAYLKDYSSSSNRNKLISPAFDLTLVSNPNLKFWHNQQVNGTSQDELRVYYKTTTTGTWNLLATYTNNISGWTSEKINLPNPSSNYYVAFEGDAKYGYGVCIDDISITQGCLPPSNPASGFSASNLTNRSMTIGWTRGNGTNVLVVARASEPVNVLPLDGVNYDANPVFGLGQEIGTGNFVVYNGVSSSLDITGLSPGTNYYYAIFEYNSLLKCYLTSPLLGNATNLCPLDVPYYEGFEKGTIPTCWQQEAGSPVWQVIKGNWAYSCSAHTGLYNASFYDYSIASNRNKLITPSINLSTVTNPTLKFWHNQQVNGSSQQDELRVYYKTSSTDTWNLLATYTNNVNLWTMETISLPDPSGDYYLAFEGDAKYGLGVCIDDVSIYSGCQLPSVQANNFTVSNLTNNSLTIGWSRGNGNRVMVVARAGSPVNEFPTDGISYNANAIFGSGQELGTGSYVVYDGTGTSVNIAELKASTNYYFAIFEYNSSSHCYLSSPLNGNAITLCSATIPYYESFEDGLIPTCWSQESGPPIWYFIEGNGNSEPANAHSGLKNAYLRDYSATSNRNKLISPSFNLTSVSNPTLKFWHSQQLNGSYQDELRVYYKTSLSSSWVLLATYTNNITTWEGETLILPNGSSDYYLAFEGDAKHGNGVCIDDITISSGCIPPTIQAQNFTVSNMSQNSMTVNWTRGDGNSVIVVARQGNPVNAFPADGTTYSANGAFGSGTQIGTGNYVVYNGTGTSVPISGLMPGITYYFAIYEYNSGANCYKTPALIGNASTDCTQPTIQASSFTSSSLTSNSMTIGWTPGNGGSILVVARQGNAVNADPVSRTAYSANASFGNGTQIGAGNYAVYNGSGNSVNINGLIPNTIYYFAVYEYSESGCYKTPALIGNATTAECIQPTIQASSFTSSSITSNSMTLGWTRGDGNSVIVIARQGSAVNYVPVDGTVYDANSVFGNDSQIGIGNYVVYRGTGTSVNVTNLLQSTGYYFAVYECSATNCYKTPVLTGYATTVPCTQNPPGVGPIIQPTCTLATGSIVLNSLPSNGTWTLTQTPGGATITGIGTSTTISGLAAGTYTYTVTNSTGCTSTSSGNVVINVQPLTPAALTLGTIIQPTCSVATGGVVLNGLPSTGTWTLTRTPGGITTTGTVTSTTISGLAAGTYTYTVTNSMGCTSIASGNVVINAQPLTPTAPIVGTITQPTCLLVTGSVVLNGLPSTGTWSLTQNPGGITITGTGTSATISGLSAGIYTYTVTNSIGCTSAASGNVVINAQPLTPAAPTLGAITQPTCAVATGSVVLNGLPSIGTWTLTRSQGGTTYSGSGTSYTVASLPSGTYTFTMTNSSGCISGPSENIVIDSSPTPPAPVVETIIQPNCFFSTGSVTLSGLQYSDSWILTRYPGGITYSGPDVPYTVSGLPSGTYNFTVTNNTTGCISAASENVVIRTSPITPSAPTFETITQPTCSVSTGSVILNGLPSGGSWTLTRTPEGTTISGTGTSTTISGLSAGTYTYTVTNYAGCTSTASGNVVIDAQPLTPSYPLLGTITQPTCTSTTGSVVLYGLPETGTWTLTQTPGGTTITGTGTSTTIFGLVVGKYTFTVTNSTGCTSTASGNMFINSARPEAPVITLNGNILHSNATIGNQWYNQLGLINGAISQDYTVILKGDYYVIVTTDGCSSVSSNIINVIPSGIELTQNNKKIKVYPNPVSNELIIEIEGNNAKINFEILNSIGKIVYKSSLFDKAIVQTANFVPGIYIIKLEDGNTFEFKKVIKE